MCQRAGLTRRQRGQVSVSLLIRRAEHLGLDVENIQAYNAKDPKSRRAYLTTIREYFARVKMFMDLITYDDKTERKNQ